MEWPLVDALEREDDLIVDHLDIVDREDRLGG
jgi:hypothetical protein